MAHSPIIGYGAPLMDGGEAAFSSSRLLPGDECLLLLAQPLDAEATTSPAFRKSGGFMPRPTPGGVPVVMMSPGCSVMNWLT